MNRNNINVQTIEERLIREVAAMVSSDVSTITPDTPLHALGLDSLRFVELLVFIEKAFNRNLMELGLKREDFQTISSLASCIVREK